jgi:hypothetical protein
MSLTIDFLNKNSSRTCPMDGLTCAYPCSKLVHAKLRTGLLDDQVVSVLGVSRSTWWRYRKGQKLPPKAVCALLSVLSGVLPWFEWRNFMINPLNGKLFNISLRDGFTPNSIMEAWWLRQEIRILRAGKTKSQDTQIESQVVNVRAC